MLTFVSKNKSLSTEESLQNARYVFDYLTSVLGWTPNAVCGLLGNTYVESKNNPGAWQSYREGNLKGGYGIVQWTPASKYIDWAKDNAYDISGMEGQLQRLKYEMENGYQYYKTKDHPLTFKQFISSAESPEYLACAFVYNYERPASPNVTLRSSKAQEYYQRFAINEAQPKEAKITLNEKAQKVKDWALSKVGCPYLYGGTEQKCTPAYRKARMKQYPTYADKMKANCPVLSGKQASCDGCKYEGLDAYDCAQLTKFGMKQVGISLPSGAKSQRNSKVWALTGDINNRPIGYVYQLFKVSGTDVPHTGIGLDDDTFVHAKGHDYGVKHETYKQYMGWTEWRIPVGLYSSEEIEQIKAQLNKGSVVSDKPIGKAVVTGSKKLYIRSDKSTKSKALGSLAKNAIIEYYADDGIWVTFKYNGKTAYSMRQFMTVELYPVEQPVPEQPTVKTMKVSGCNVPLNVRDAPSVDGTDIGDLAVGAVIIVLATEGDWAKFLYNGKEAWCSLKYLESV